MRVMVVLWLVLGLLGERAGAASRSGGTRYVFYRSMKQLDESGAVGANNTRRVFGGRSTTLEEYSPTCALLDRYWTPRCSAAVVSPRWALTAAHCVSPEIAYIKYNTRHPITSEGDLATVEEMFRHPGYRVRQEDEGRGVDVTVLNHDLGLVRTRQNMFLSSAPKVDPLSNMRLYTPDELISKKVQVLGFGRTERSDLGEELFTVQLQVGPCDRASWFHCLCATSPRDMLSGKRVARGVCSGDSGGPVLYRGAQVGITSMGPLECTTMRVNPPESATSVITSLYNYAYLVNATIHDTEVAVRMRRIGTSAAAPPRPAARASLLTAALALLAGTVR